MKIIHTGDLHFDPQLLSEIVKCTDFLADAIRPEQPDMIILAGDTFHDSVELGSPAALAAMEFIRKCGDIAPVLIIRGTTTHDAEGSVTALGKLKAAHQIFVTDKLQQVYLLDSGQFVKQLATFDRPVALFSCLPSVTKAAIAAGRSMDESNATAADLLRDVLKAWGQINEQADVPAILVGHITVTGAVTPTGQVMTGRDLELSTGDLRLAKADLVCLGHIHKMQSWQEIFYCGSITRLNHGEANDPKGFFIHEFTGKPLRASSFVETPARIMKTRRPETIPTIEDVADVQPDEHVRLVFEISDDDVAKLDEQAIIKAALARGAADVKIEKVIIPKNTTRAEGISRLGSVEEKLKKWAELSDVTLTEGILNKLAELEQPEQTGSLPLLEVAA